ncbi:hypothetical protein [Novipirellula caenicola]|uniref:MarR family protein n=1 Tax=Novipirellula caenicola TaxID=1536901 RepID=A0ABP9VNF2_9BACT
MTPRLDGRNPHDECGVLEPRESPLRPKSPEKAKVNMEEANPSWTFIPAPDFSVPVPPVTDAARGTLKSTWHFIRHALRRSSQSTFTPATDLDSPAESLLSNVTPMMDPVHAARGLTDSIGDTWFECESSSHRIRPVIGPPGCDVSAILQQLAEQRELRVLGVPPADSLLEPSTDDAISAIEDDLPDRDVLVVPHLERWYLRHEEGLSRMRALLERLMSVRNRVLIGCDSWTWAFLSHAVGIEDQLGTPLTLAPMDAEELYNWFRSTLPLEQYEFRRSGHDHLLFPELEHVDHGHDDDAENLPNTTSDFFTTLAVTSRGNPGLARAIWTASLRTRNPTDDAPQASNPNKTTLWVVSPDQLATPQMPASNDRVHRFILHAILLHGGLSLDSLATVLSFPRDEIRRRVSELCRGRVLVTQDDLLRVNLIAYPIVRRDLQSEGFLTDAF